ncbi:MAG: hypothetical protein VX641_05065 [Planctomycetota bacterium]|nr:hypothetical protein [Planctomycetota bacterium]
MTEQTWIRRTGVGCGCVAALMLGAADCPTDLDASGAIDGGDLTMMLAAWGPCTPDCAEDLDGDGVVSGTDLAELLAAWGRERAVDCDCDGTTDAEAIAAGAADLDGDGRPDDCTPAEPEGVLLFEQTLDHREAGPYDELMMEADWNDPSWSNGVRDGRVSIIETGTPGDRALAVLYPEGEYGTSKTGAQWKVPLGGSYERVSLSYRIRFPEGFDFVKGGKLPGLIGGTGNTGGSVPDGTDGWSARMMWRTEGAIVQYVYHPDQPGGFGEDLPWSIEGEPIRFEPGRWYTLRHEITMNTPGEYDGVIRTWLDDTPTLTVTDMRFRDLDTLAIDTLYFSTFFGGGSPSWATTRDEVVWFDDFEVRALEN